jgi:hypothetical protein
MYPEKLERDTNGIHAETCAAELLLLFVSHVSRKDKERETRARETGLPVLRLTRISLSWFGTGYAGCTGYSVGAVDEFLYPGRIPKTQRDTLVQFPAGAHGGQATTGVRYTGSALGFGRRPS